MSKCKHEHYTIVLARFGGCTEAGCQRQVHSVYAREMAVCLSCDRSATYERESWGDPVHVGAWKPYKIVPVNLPAPDSDD